MGQFEVKDSMQAVKYLQSEHAKADAAAIKVHIDPARIGITGTIINLLTILFRLVLRWVFNIDGHGTAQGLLQVRCFWCPCY